MVPALTSEIAVYAVVVAYNGSAWLGDCLASLKLSRHPVRIIVVDNASTEDIQHVLARFTGVLCLHLPTNLGFGRANNIGISTALADGADFVFLLNQDASVRHDTIENLISSAQVHPSFGVLSPLQLNGDGSQLDTNFAQYLTLGANQFYSDLYFGHLQQVYPTRFVNAAAWLISRNCLERIGGFDPLFFMYGEDDDFCNRADYHGFRVGIVPSAIAFHARESGPSLHKSKWQNLKQRSNRLLSSMLLCMKQHSSSMITQFLLVCSNIMHGGMQSVLRGDRHGLVSLILAAAMLVTRLPRIWRHRGISRVPGMHWLREAAPFSYSCQAEVMTRDIVVDQQQ